MTVAELNENLSKNDQLRRAELTANFERDFPKNPGAYGFCSFEEFRKNKDKWRANPEQALESVETARTVVKKQIRKMTHELEGYPCASLEAVQAQARQMGFLDKDLVYFPVPHNHLAGQFDILVRWFHKDTVKKREGW
jgi:cell division protein FtsB